MLRIHCWGSQWLKSAYRNILEKLCQKIHQIWVFSGLFEVIQGSIFQFWTFKFSTFQSRSETVPKILPNRPKIIPKPSQIRPKNSDFFDFWSEQFRIFFTIIIEDSDYYDRGLWLKKRLWECWLWYVFFSLSKKRLWEFRAGQNPPEKRSFFFAF